MRSLALAAASVAALGCVDYQSTDITGAYLCNATYTLDAADGSGAIGAGSAIAVIGDSDLALATACDVATTQLDVQQLQDGNDDIAFVESARAIGAGQPCALALAGGSVTIAIVQGTFTVDRARVLSLALGGAITAAADPVLVGGYAVVQLSGARYAP